MTIKVLPLLVLSAVIVVGGCGGSTGPDKHQPIPSVTLSIDSVGIIPGETAVTVSVRLDYAADSTPDLAGFSDLNLLLSYDSSLLSLVDVRQGEALTGWEYFTYRTGAPPPSPLMAGLHLLEIHATRELDNGTPSRGALHPRGAIATITFETASGNLSPGICATVPFFMMQDCNDNAIITDSDTSSRTYIPIIGAGNARLYPGFNTRACTEHKTMTPALQLLGGGVCVRNSAVIRGDIDLDGIPFSHSDEDLFRDFLMQGYDVWNPADAGRQIAGTDCNGDGEPLTVADFDFLNRVINGDVQPDDSLPPVYPGRIILEIKQTGEDWTINAVASDSVSALWLQVVDTSGGYLTLDWFARSINNVEMYRKNDVLRILIFDWDRTRILEPGSYPLLRVHTTGTGNLSILAAQASTYPGVPLRVEIARGVGGDR